MTRLLRTRAFLVFGLSLLLGGGATAHLAAQAPSPGVTMPASLGVDAPAPPASAGPETMLRAFAVELEAGSGLGDVRSAASGFHWAPRFGGALRLDWRVRPRLSVYGGASRTAFGCDQGFCRDFGVRFVSQGFELGVRGQSELRGRPWVRLGVVRHRLGARWSEPGGSGSARSDAGFGVEAGAGVQVSLGPRLSLAPALRFVRHGASDLGGPRGPEARSASDQVRLLVLVAGLRLAL